MVRRLTVLLAASLFLGNTLLAAQAAKSSKPSKPSAGARLHAILDEDWEWQLRDQPEDATEVGDRRYDDKLTDLSPEAFERRRQHDRDILAKVKGIERAKLNAADQLNYDLFREQVEWRVEGGRFPIELMPLDQMDGAYALLSDSAQKMSRDTVKNHEDFLERMRAFPLYVDQTIALMRRGAEKSITPPRVVLRNVAELITNQIVEDPTKSSIYELAFTNFPQTIPAAEQQRLQGEAANVIRAQVVPAMRKLHDYFTREYLPKTREAIGWSTLPSGPEWYAWSVKTETTTSRTPDEIHAIGLAEVKRIRAEMERVKNESGFKGSLSEFFEFLRTDPRFFYTEREGLLLGYRDISKRIDPELTKLFGTLPRLPYGVIPVPAYSEKVNTTAYYGIGSPEAHRPGYFYANLYALESRPKWEMEALTLHEAVPGHHLQIALGQELGDVPKFRRSLIVTAFVEGWGLYAESLGPELGMYKDPYSKFGQLTYEMWRAVRLVVDTGMHMKGWSRQQAIDYFLDNASKAKHDIEVEVDRYLVWPGQALAYKTGELKIKELRAWSQKQLGEKFDIREFHDTLLGAGALPLSLVEARIHDWVARKQGSRKVTVTLVQ